MNAKVRSRIDMGRRALQFSRANPDASAGYTAAVTRLEERLARAETLADQQLNGIRAARASTAQKHTIRRSLIRGHLRHLAQVAQLASAELPEIGKRIALPPRNSTYAEFRTTARTIAAEAEAHREVLVRYGLVESVLEELGAALTRFEETTDAGTDARRSHVGASAELDTVVAEIIGVVRVIDALNRIRFAADAERLAAWRTSSNVVDVVRSAVPPVADGGEVQPAA